MTAVTPAQRGSTRPTEWREREDAGEFVGWLAPSRSAALLEMGIAAAVTAFGVGHALVFGDRFERHPLEMAQSIVLGVLALALWIRAATALLPAVRLRIGGGRLELGKAPLAALSTTTLPLADVVGVRAEARAIGGRRLRYELFDVVIDARDGTSHRIETSRVSAEEAEWIARRLAIAAGLAPPGARP